jgi:hypothetical protein
MSHRVILPYDPSWRALEWAKKHCSSYITNNAVERKYNRFFSRYYDIEYIFSNQKDAVLFSLRWL